jgi:acetoin utilization deacetylase AcuC-like enzyme
MATGLVTHPDYLKHDAGRGHPESPERLKAIEAHLHKTGLMDQLTAVAVAHPDEAGLAPWIDAAHAAGYRDALHRAVPPQGIRYLDADTGLSPGSWPAALAAVGGALSAVDEVISGRVNNVFCAVRPPGHHAESGRGMGFCLFNNVAIAARYLQRRHKVGKVAIVDWDVHHGNGTQDVVRGDETILFVSLHQWPLYPGTGGPNEQAPNVVNIPLPAGTGDDGYAAAWETVSRSVTAFEPDLLLVSAGFDAHADDPLADMELTADGFRELARSAAQLAPRVAAVLEGGYNLRTLPDLVEAALEGFSG